VPTVHTHYVTYVRGHRRRHAGAVAADIITPLTSTVTDPGQYQALASPSMPWTDGNGKQVTVDFAFWSVVGAADGASITTNQSLAVNVDSTDVTATAWYIPTGGGPNGGPGVIIDAFDVGQGAFVDDDFVSVSPDGNLTFEANDDGWVPTATAEDIEAYALIHSVPFSKWLVVAGTELTKAGDPNDLQAQAQSVAVAFAFYQVPAPSTPPGWRGPLGQGYAMETWVSYGVMVDAGGPTGRGPVPPWNPHLRELAAGLAVAEAGLLLRPASRAAALRVAATQVEAAAATIAEHMQAAAKTAG
jgi:hypothetical protein